MKAQTFLLIKYTIKSFIKYITWPIIVWSFLFGIKEKSYSYFLLCIFVVSFLFFCLFFVIWLLDWFGNQWKHLLTDPEFKDSDLKFNSDISLCCKLWFVTMRIHSLSFSLSAVQKGREEKGRKGRREERRKAGRLTMLLILLLLLFTTREDEKYLSAWFRQAAKQNQKNNQWQDKYYRFPLPLTLVKMKLSNSSVSYLSVAKTIVNTIRMKEQNAKW